MKKPAVLLLAAVFIVSILILPKASAGSVSVSISGEKNVKPGHTYTYTYTINMNDCYEIQTAFHCTTASLSGDTKASYTNSVFDNSNFSTSGILSIKTNESASTGDIILITLSGRYSIINEESIPNLGGEISESYTLTVVSDEVPTPEPTTPPSEPIPSEAALPDPDSSREPEATPTPKPTAHHSAKPSNLESDTQTSQTHTQIQSDELQTTVQPSNSADTSDLSSLSSQLDLMPQGGTVVVSMDPFTENILPALTLRVLKAKQGTMIIDFYEYSCTIDGNKLAATINNPVNLYIDMTKKQKITDAADGYDIYQLHFGEDSDFPGCLVYTIPTVENQPGDVLYIYQYHTISGINEYKQSVTVDDNGHASFDIYEGGSYFISAALITDNPPTGDATVVTSTVSDLLYIVIPASCVLLAAAVIIAALIIRKTANNRHSSNR